MNDGSHITYAFLGSGLFAARCLTRLSAWRLPSWVVTAPPTRAGRGQNPTPTPVGALIEGGGIFDQTVLSLSRAASTDEAVMNLKKERPVTFIFVVDFGQFIREPLLAWNEPIGCLNIHPSMLPRYRGAAPIQRALMDGALETGVTIFKLSPGMDAGPVLLQKTLPINEDDDTGALIERAARIGTEAFIAFADRVPPERWTFLPQDEGMVSVAPKIRKDEERIDWRKPARTIRDQIRALSPKPGAWTTIRDKRLRILKASLFEGNDYAGSPGELLGDRNISPIVVAGEGLLALHTVQMEGKKVQTALEWRNGLRAEPEECLL